MKSKILYKYNGEWSSYFESTKDTNILGPGKFKYLKDFLNFTGHQLKGNIKPSHTQWCRINEYASNSVTRLATVENVKVSLNAKKKKHDD